MSEALMVTVVTYHGSVLKRWVCLMEMQVLEVKNIGVEII